MSEQLSTRLREGTKSVHRKAEQSGIMQDILRRKITRGPYVLLLRNLVEVYEALEQAMRENATHPGVAPLFFAVLERVGPLEEDLTALHGSTWRTDLPVLPGAKAYADRIRSVSKSSPALLAAHSYTRYLGDLSGGQILRKMLGEGLGLEGGRGTAFYDFPAIADPNTFKQGYREALDKLPIGPTMADQVVAEAVQAFELNSRLFEEIATAPIAR